MKKKNKLRISGPLNELSNFCEAELTFEISYLIILSFRITKAF